MPSPLKFRKKRRLYLLVASLLSVASITALTLTVLEETLVFFYAPSDLVGTTKKANPSAGQVIRLGGLVAENSLRRAEGSHKVEFIVTDQKENITVTYTGILPDLFREGQGVVAQGIYHQDGGFQAHSVLAKHDENYMPREVSDALKKTGRWQQIEQ